MRKVLILAYDFPPYVSVGGLRPFNWYLYFHKFGVYPIVITRQWDNKYGNQLDYVAPSNSSSSVIEKTEFGTIIRTPYFPNISNRLLLKHGEKRFRLIRKSFTVFYELFQFIGKVGPKKEIYRAADQYLKENKVEAIIATGDPFILFKYASDLSEKYNTPWIADYRDPWSQGIYVQRIPILRMWSSFFEKKIVNTAKCFTTVDDFFASKISALVPDVPFKIVPNGYDPEAMDKVRNIKQQQDELRLSFVGSIYDWHPIKSFLTVFREFVKNKQIGNFKLRFYGINNEESIKQIIDSDFPEIKDCVKFFPKMNNDRLLEYIAADNVMLLFNYYSFMGTKIFDYLGVRRKILLCYENDKEAMDLKSKYYNLDEVDSVNRQVQADLIKTTNSGVVVRDSKHLYEVFEDLYFEFSNTQYIACNSTGVENYSRKIQVGELAKIIDDVLN